MLKEELENVITEAKAEVRLIEERIVEILKEREALIQKGFIVKGRHDLAFDLLKKQIEEQDTSGVPAAQA